MRKMLVVFIVAALMMLALESPAMALYPTPGRGPEVGRASCIAWIAHDSSGQVPSWLARAEPSNVVPYDAHLTSGPPDC